MRFSLGCTSVLWVISYLAFSLAPATAEVLIETNYRNQPITCRLDESGVVSSGKIRKGRFREAKISRYKRRLKRAQATRDVRRISSAKRALKRARKWRKQCIRFFKDFPSPGSSPSPSPEPPVNPTEVKAVLDTHCVSCHLGQHESWSAFDGNDDWIAADGRTGEALINTDSPADSLLLRRITFYGAADSTMPLLNNNSNNDFGSGDYALLRNWVLGLANPIPTPDPGETATPSASPSPNPSAPPITGGSFSEAFALIQNHCANCHLNQHLSWNNLQTEDAWLRAEAQSGENLINELNLGDSLLLRRIRFYGGDGANMPLAPNLNAPRTFNIDDYGVIRNWIVSLGEGAGSSPSPSPSSTPDAGPTPPPPSGELRGNELTSNELFQCGGEIEPSDERIRLIGRDEWAATLGLKRDTYTTDAKYNPLAPLPTHQYSSFDENETLGEAALTDYFNFLSYTVAGWQEGYNGSSHRRPDEFYCMTTAEAPSAECIEDFARVYLRDFVFFRAPLEDEIARLSSFAQDVISEGDRSTEEGREATMELITSAAWLMTGAIFRSEQGEELISPGVRRLTDEEIGHSLSYMFSDQAPGTVYRMKPNKPFIMWYQFWGTNPRTEAIKSAVEDGSISQPSTLDVLIEMNLSWQDPSWPVEYSEYRMGEKVEHFFSEWLGLSAIENTFHDTPSATADTGSAQHVTLSFNHHKRDASYGKEISYTNQLLQMVGKIVQDDQDVISNLFTSRDFFLPHNAQSFKATYSPQAVYNEQGDISDTREARWKTLPNDERAGILTHPAWLMAHSDNFENGPSAVLRGKWIRENVLCGMVPDIPITVDARFPPETDHLSARERLQLATGETYCQTCHSLMNPLGLPFEIYNHAGFLRASDHGSAPNGSSTIVYSGDPTLDGPVSDAVQFSEKLADSPVVEQCFIRQVFRFFMGRLETAADSCTLVAMQDSYQSNGGSMKAMLQTLVKSPAFLHRKEYGAE